MLKYKSRVLFTLLPLLFLQGCSAGQKNVVPEGRSVIEYAETDLIFGLCKNDLCASENDFVSEEEWTSFLDNYIIPQFPDGLTVVNAIGQWRDKSGKLIKERSKVVVLVYPSGLKSEQSVERIRASYKTLFHQDSVLKIRKTKVDVSF